MDKPSPDRLAQAIISEWDENTSSTPDEWSPVRRERGQCVPTSLVVQDFLGGDIVRVAVVNDGVDETHYYNVVDGEDMDLTRAQYADDIKMTPAQPDFRAEGYASMRERLVANARTNMRYELLRARVFRRLGEQALE